VLENPRAVIFAITPRDDMECRTGVKWRYREGSFEEWRADRGKVEKGDGFG
jgi:hypothetical protein